MDSNMQLSPTRLQFPNLTIPVDKPLDKDVAAQLFTILKRRSHFEPEDTEIVKKLKISLAKNNHPSLLTDIDNAARRLVFPHSKERPLQTDLNLFQLLPRDVIKLITSHINDKESRKAFHKACTRFALLLNDRDYLSNIINRNEFAITSQFYMNFTVYELILTTVCYPTKTNLFDFNGRYFESKDFYERANNRAHQKLDELDIVTRNIVHSQALVTLADAKRSITEFTEFYSILERKFLLGRREMSSIIEKCGDRILNLDFNELMGESILMQRPTPNEKLSYLKKCPNLQRLSLFLFASEARNLELFQALTKLKNLTELVIEGKGKSTDVNKSVNEIKKIHNLQRLTLKYFDTIEEIFLKTVDELSQLRSLEIVLLGRELPNMQHIQKIKENHPDLKITIVRGYMFIGTDVYKPYDDQNY